MRWLAVVLLLFPLVAFVTLTALADGWRAALVIWGSVLFLLACTFGGLYLLVSEAM